VGNDQNGPKPKRPTRMSKTAHAISPKLINWAVLDDQNGPCRGQKMAPTQTEMTKTAQK